MMKNEEFLRPYWLERVIEFPFPYWLGRVIEFPLPRWRGRAGWGWLYGTILFTLTNTVSALTPYSDYNPTELTRFQHQFQQKVIEYPEDIQAKIDLAYVYLAQNQFDKSAVLGEQLKQSGKTMHWMPILGKIWILQEEYDAVLEQLIPDDSADPFNRTLLTLRAEALLGKGEVAQSLAVLKTLETKSPPVVEVLDVLAKAYTARLDFKQAEEVLEQAQRSGMRVADVATRQGDIDRLKGDFSIAKASYERALRANPNHLEAHLHLASLQMAMGDMQGLNEHLDLLQHVLPNNPEVGLLQAFLLSEQGQLNVAQKTLEQVIGKRPNWDIAHLLLGRVYFSQGQWDKAEAEVSPLLERDTIQVRTLLSAIALKKDQPQKAIDLLFPYVSSLTEEPRLLTLLGTAYLLNKQPEEGLPLLTQAERFKKNPPPPLEAPKVADLTPTLPPLALSDSEFTHDITVILSHLEKNQVELAEQNTLAYARTQGKTALSQYLLGLCAEAKGNSNLALLSYQSALERDPNFLPARYRLSDNYLKKFDWGAAEKSIQATLDSSPKNMTAWLQMAQLLENQNKKTEAKLALDKAARAHPNKVEPKQAQMTFYLRQGQPEKALEIAQNLYQEYPHHYTFAHLYGQLALENKQYKVAAQVFETLTQKAPSTPSVWQGLAESEYQLGKINQARDRVDTVLSLDTHFLPAWILKAHIAEKEKDYPTLIEVGKQLQKEAPQAIIGDTTLAKGYAAQNQLGKAKEAYQQAFLKVPSAHLAKSIYYLDQQLGEPTGATIPLEEWLDKHPEDAPTWRFLASEYLKKGESQKAERCYEQLLNTHTQDLIALNNLALLKIDKNPAQALVLAKKAYALASQQPKVIDTYGMALFKNNQREEALAVLQQAKALFPDNKDVQEHLQWVLEH